MQSIHPATDSHTQLRALYQSLLEDEGRFHEFKQLLALYPLSPPETGEQREASIVRERLNGRIREWVGAPFEGLSAVQTMLWRSIVVEERFNIALSPWKEANVY